LNGGLEISAHALIDTIIGKIVSVREHGFKIRTNVLLQKDTVYDPDDVKVKIGIFRWLDCGDIKNRPVV